MSQKISLIFLIVANFLIPISILTFATGFFPYKTYIAGRATFEHGDPIREAGSAPFDSVIFMVVDALRRW